VDLRGSVEVSARRSLQEEGQNLRKLKHSSKDEKEKAAQDYAKRMFDGLNLFSTFVGARLDGEMDVPKAEQLLKAAAEVRFDRDFLGKFCQNFGQIGKFGQNDWKLIG